MYKDPGLGSLDSDGFVPASVAPEMPQTKLPPNKTGKSRSGQLVQQQAVFPGTKPPAEPSMLLESYMVANN